MNSKQLNIALGIAVVALLGVVGYMALKNSSPENNLPNCEEISLDQAIRIDIQPTHEIVRQNGRIYICPKKIDNAVQPLDNQQLVDNTVPEQTDETANWKTYTSTGDLKFSINYPSSWTVETHKYTDGGRVNNVVSIDSGAQRVGSVNFASDTEAPIDCKHGAQEIVKIRNNSIKMCHFLGSAQEPEGYYYNGTTPAGPAIYQISANPYPGTSNRDMILKILGTLHLN